MGRTIFRIKPPSIESKKEIIERFCPDSSQDESSTDDVVDERLLKEVESAGESIEREPAATKESSKEDDSKLIERVAIVLSGLDQAERIIYSKDRNYIKYKWYLPTRSRKTKIGRVSLNNKHYKTLVKITNWLYNACSGKGNALQIVATDYGCSVATTYKERYRTRKPFFISGYSPTQINKSIFEQFIANYEKDEDVSYWKQRPKGWSIVYGHIKIDEQSRVIANKLNKAERVLEQKALSGELASEYDYVVLDEYERSEPAMSLTRR